MAPLFGDKPVDELAVAGGFRGKPLEVVQSETSDLLVPAHAEMIIEGEVPLQGQGMPEGPFGEMFGYMGPHKEENFFLNVTAVTHRRDPWVVNMYTGMQRGMVTSPQDALSDFFIRRGVPNLVESYQPQDVMGVYIISIDKNAPGQPKQGKTSKIIIDATMQWPEEGGRDKFPATNRTLLEKEEPNVFAEVDRLYGTALEKWADA